jgi:nucleotide-binding universal stress UspA family protein
MIRRDAPDHSTRRSPVPAPYATIACCISADPASDAVVAEAAALRAQGPGDLVLVTVAGTAHTSLAGPFSYYTEDPAILVEEAEAWLAERAATVPGARTVVLDGYPPRAVCRWAAETGVDLIVAAAHRGVVERTLLGGFAAYVAYHAPCPVLLTRPPAVPEES